MNEVAEFFHLLFSTDGFPPRWFCGRWTDFHGWVYIAGDLMIWAAYFAIPLIIFKYMSRRRTEVRFQRIYWLFAAFILACGATHLIDVIIFWHPVYRFSALVRVLTGLVSLATVLALFKALPTAFQLKSPQALEREVQLRQAAEEALTEKNALLVTAQHIARLGYWRFNVRTGEVWWSEEMYRLWGLHAGQKISYEMYLDSVLEADRPFVSGVVQEAIASGNYATFYHRISTPDGVRHILAQGRATLDAQGAVEMLSGTAQDVTERRLAELQVITKSRQLEAVNADLENFAYVASHDLQEPLRKVTTFSKILQMELGNNLTPDAQYSIDKLVDAAGRMRVLIQDILHFSRLGYGREMNKVDLNSVLQTVMSDLETRIADTGAVIEADQLPTIEGDAGQMSQLLTNLLSNALKFTKPDATPKVRVRSKLVFLGDLPEGEAAQLRKRNGTLPAEQLGSVPLIRLVVEDDGIGFEPQYAEKIFAVFQRLHTRDTYAGTGIGLAVCKKIADHHHGIIRAESELGHGAKFIVTLPVSQALFEDDAVTPYAADVADGFGAAAAAVVA